MYCTCRPSNFSSKSYNQHPRFGSPHADQTVLRAGRSVLEPITNVHLNSQRLETQSCAEMTDNFSTKCEEYVISAAFRQLFKSSAVLTDGVIERSLVHRSMQKQYSKMLFSSVTRRKFKRGVYVPANNESFNYNFSGFNAQTSDQKRCFQSTTCYVEAHSHKRQQFLVQTRPGLLSRPPNRWVQAHLLTLYRWCADCFI
jgi:hypothetical protein